MLKINDETTSCTNIHLPYQTMYSKSSCDQILLHTQMDTNVHAKKAFTKIDSEHSFTDT